MLIDGPRVESVLVWMRGKHASELLIAIGSRELSLSHADFDQFPHRSAAEHLRAVLEEHHMMPRRADPELERFERWLEQRIGDLETRPTVQQPIGRFGRWHHLRSLRAKSPHITNMNYAMRSAKQEITEAGKFLIWLAETHGRDLAAASQVHVDEYVASGPSTRKMIRSFLRYANRESPGRAKLDLPYRRAQTTPILSEERRLEMLRSFIEGDEIEPLSRVAGLIFLLYGVPLSKIAALTTEDIAVTATGMTIALADEPTPIPDLVAPIFWAYYERRSKQVTPTNRALFPSSRAGRPIGAEGVRVALARHGIVAQGTRNATLRDLAGRVDASALATALGYTAPTLIRHARAAGVSFSSYAAARTNAARGSE